MENVCNYGNGYNSNNSVAIIWAIEDVRRPIRNTKRGYAREG